MSTEAKRPQGLRMLLGAFRGRNPLERIVAKPSKWSVKLPRNRHVGDYSRELGQHPVTHWHRHMDVKRPTRQRAGIGSWPAAMEAAGMSRHAKGKPKTKASQDKLGLPDLDHSKSAVLDSLRSPESKRGYRHAIDEFIQWYCSEPRLSFNRVVVTRYRIFLENRQLAAGTINGRLAAVRRLAYEAADAGLLSPELAAGIRRVKGAKKLGVRLGNWLTAEEARRLWQSPDADTLKGKRDRAILAVLLGCGLRRRELADLDFTHLQQREEHWAIVDLVGKGGHIRTVPVPDWVKATIDAWIARRRDFGGETLPMCLSSRQTLG